MRSVKVAAVAAIRWLFLGTAEGGMADKAEQEGRALCDDSGNPYAVAVASTAK